MANKLSKHEAVESADIPVAVRETPAPKGRGWWKLILISCAGLGFGGLSMLATIFLLSNQSTTIGNFATPSPTGSVSESSPSPTADSLLGHLPYKEAPASDLQPLASDPQIRLRTNAALSFDAMVQAAQSQGVLLVPLSGYRSVAEQQQLFFAVKAERAQLATKRAEVSAPPGYSEHHTGYAIDIGDGRLPATNLSQDFARTEAFQWLQQNAPRFSFELSFPPGNPQGISYEPWHWRFVGDIHSLETFYKSQQRTR